MRSLRVVVHSPSFDHFFRVIKCHELMCVQALVAKATVKALYVPVFLRLSRRCEVEFYFAIPCPVFECFRRKLRAMIAYAKPDAIDGEKITPSPLRIGQELFI